MEGVCWPVSAEGKVLLLSLSSKSISGFVGYSLQNESTGVCRNKKGHHSCRLHKVVEIR